LYVHAYLWLNMVSFVVLPLLVCARLFMVKYGIVCGVAPSCMCTLIYPC